MMHRPTSRWVLWVCALAAPLALAGCADSESDAPAGEEASGDTALEPTGDSGEATADADGEAEADTDSASATLEPPAIICRPGGGWNGDGQIFGDATAFWGLDGAIANRLNTVDIDGDGWPDLIARNSDGLNDFAAGERHFWLWMNRPDGRGGRTFVDFTEESGITARQDGTDGRRIELIVWGDVDNDGDLDAFTSSPSFSVFAPNAPDPGDRSELMLNNGDGTFELATPEVLRHPFGDDRYRTTGASFLDFDSDGNLDLWVGYGVGPFTQPHQDSLYRNDGEGGFEDVTANVGLETQNWLNGAILNGSQGHHRTWGTTVCDLNNDGGPDLVASAYGRSPNGLFLSTAEGGFTNASVASGFAFDHRDDWTLDYNAQCYCELVPGAEDCDTAPSPPEFFPCSNPNELRWNHDQGREPYRLGGNTFSTLCGDVDNDGDLDLMNFEIVHWDVGPPSDPTELLLNNGDATFARPGNETNGLQREWDIAAWNEGDITGSFVDFDNDGRLDILYGTSDYPSTRAFLFHQKADQTFGEVEASHGFYYPRAQGIAVADFDGDGDLDIVLGHSRMRCSGNSSECFDTERLRVFRNDVGHQANALEVELVGAVGTNHRAIGARVTIVAGGLTQTAEVSGGFGHNGIQNGTVLHFGLGAACEVDSLVIRWPDKSLTVETVGKISANWRVRIEQGEGLVAYEPFGAAE